LFFSFLLPSSVLFYIAFALFISFVFIWVRITFCRFRYDMLMMASWKILLPFSLFVFSILIFFFL
jgi:NADH:ubiquinone oxidoreductase subunit H